MSRARPRGVASQERRSWRHSSLARRPQGSRVRSLRWLFTLLVLVLIGLFAVVIVPAFRHGRSLVAIAIWATDPLAVPPVPYASEDIAALARIPDVVPRQSIGLQDQASFARLGDQLRGIAGRRDDLLALYLVAHGITDGDQAYLVCSDFLRSEGAGRYPVRDLLAQLADCPGRLRLLVLDAGRLGYEPRLGMAANEFSRLVARDVAAMPPQELWVLLPSRSLERTAVAHPWRQSLFGYSVADALQGNANRNPPDPYVTLFELYQHVRAQSARWIGSDASMGPTPLLIKAGIGIVEPDSEQDGRRHRLVWVHDKPVAESQTPPAADTAEVAATDQNPAEPQPSPSAGAESETAAPKTAAGASDGQIDDSTDDPADGPTSQTAAATAAEAEPAQNPRLWRQLTDAWTLRDELQASQADPENSPIHLAPHLWRELNARLLHYEQRVWAGTPVAVQATPGQDSANSIDRLDQGLELLQNDLRLLQTRWHAPIDPGPGQFRHDVVRRLDDARWRAATPAVSRTTTQSDQLPEVRRIREAAYGWNRLVFEARDYVRWYDLASLSDSSPLPIYDHLRQYLESLADFQQRLAALQAQPLSSQELPLLADARTEFDALLARRDALDRQLQALEQNALAAAEQTRHQQQIEDLLGTPRLAAERRSQLLRQLLEASVTLPPSDGVPAAENRLSRARAQRLRERLELESRWMHLVDAQQAGALEQQAQELGETLDASQLDEERFWQLCRQAGQSMRAFYASMPLREEHIALHLVEPRDAGGMSGPAAGFEFNVTVTIAPQLFLRPPDGIQGLQRQPLVGGRSSPVSVTLVANQRELLERTPRLVFDPRLLAVTAGPEAGPVEAEAGWFRKPLTWQISALLNHEQAGRSETELSMEIDVPGSEGGQRETHRVSLILPRPNRVDLEVIRTGSTVRLIDDGTTVTLDLFPNRTTTYQLALINHSGLQRQVEVALLPARHVGLGPPGKLSTAARRSVLAAIGQDAAPLTATPVTLTLPADGRRVPMTLAAPQEQAEPTSAESGDGADSAKPKPPNEFSPVDVSHGMLCVIRDKEDPDQVWNKWIEWRVIWPRRFLGADVNYNPQRREIVARVQGRDFDGDGQPDLPVGDPVQLTWLDDENQLPNAAKQLRGKLQGTGAVELFAVAGDRQKYKVRLDVDGYPRGLVYELLREQPDGDFRPGSDIRRTDRRVRINRLIADDFPYEFHFLPYVHRPAVPPKPPAPGEAAPRTPVLVRPGEYVVLPAPCRSLRVDFEVDAPVDAFRDTDDRIEVVLGHGATPPLVLFDDRQASARLVGLGQDGLIEFQTVVNDYSVNFAPGALENVQTYLDVRLLLPGIGDVGDRVPIALVSNPPAIETVRLLSTATKEELSRQGNVYLVPQGTPLMARVQVKTLAGVRHAEYRFAGNLPGAETTRYQPTAQPPVGGQQAFDLPLDTKGLDQERYRLVLGVRDLADHDSKVEDVQLRFVTPPPPAAVKGVISGRVRFGRNHSSVQGSPPFKVTVEGPGYPARQLTARPDGSFSVFNLPPGEYTVTATGTFLNRVAVGKLEGVQPSPPNAVQEVTVVVDRPAPP